MISETSELSYFDIDSGKNGTDKNSTDKNSTSNNGTNDKVGENDTFSILGLEVMVVGLEWRFRFTAGGLSLRVERIQHQCVIFTYFLIICAIITSAIST